MPRLRLPVRVLSIGLLCAGVTTVHAGASCLLFPLSCLKPSKKYGEETDAQVLALSSLRTDVVVQSLDSGMITPRPLETTKEYWISFQVGQTRYVGWRKDTVVQMAGFLGGYRPKPGEWSGKSHKMRFMDEHWMGLKTPVAAFKVGRKDWQFVITDIIGADGINECPPWFGISINQGHCQPQQGIDRAKREADIAAKLAAEHRKPVWESLDTDTAMKVVAARDRGAKDDELQAIIASGQPGGTAAAAPTCELKDEDIAAHMTALGDYPDKSADALTGTQQYLDENRAAGANCGGYQFLAASTAAARKDWPSMRDAFLSGLTEVKEPVTFEQAFAASAGRAAPADAPLPAELVEFFQPPLDFAKSKWSGEQGLAALQARMPAE